VLTKVTYWVEAFLSCWKEEYGRVAIRLADTQRQQLIPFRYNGNHTLFKREKQKRKKKKGAYQYLFSMEFEYDD
jgi:hypothetical protein